MSLIHAYFQIEEILLFYYFTNSIFQVFEARYSQLKFDYFQHL